jgi:LPXTG-motif cell wall-anchored protein
MKKQFLSLSAMFLLMAGAALAQSANTTAPGPTQQREPGQNSNNLPNPGNPQTDLSHNTTYTENGTVEGTANENMQQDQGAAATTGTGTGVNSAYSTGTAGSTTGTTGTTTTTTTTGTATDTTGTMDTNTTVDTTAGTSTSTSTTNGNTGSLPNTGSELPLVAVAGLLALASAFMVRRAANRNA